MSLRRIIYASRARPDLQDADIAAMLRQARKRNAAVDVTGYLIYGGGGFLQVLEGAAGALGPIFRSIQRDRRHDKIQVLQYAGVGRRIFGDWEMGFVDARDLDSEPAAKVIWAELEAREALVFLEMLSHRTPDSDTTRARAA